MQTSKLPTIQQLFLQKHLQWAFTKMKCNVGMQMSSRNPATKKEKKIRKLKKEKTKQSQKYIFKNQNKKKQQNY